MFVIFFPGQFIIPKAKRRPSSFVKVSLYVNCESAMKAVILEPLRMTIATRQFAKKSNVIIPTQKKVKNVPQPVPYAVLPSGKLNEIGAAKLSYGIILSNKLH